MPSVEQRETRSVLNLEVFLTTATTDIRLVSEHSRGLFDVLIDEVRDTRHDLTM